MAKRLLKRVDTRGKDWIFITHTNPGIQAFIDLWSEYRFYQWSLEYLIELGVVDSYTEWLTQIIPEIKRILDRSWFEINKKKKGDLFFETISQFKRYNYLEKHANLHANESFEIWKIDVEPFIKKCDFCEQKFLASRINTKYCNKCWNKVHVYKYRKTHKKTFASKKCEYEGCKKKFVPKTTRARFCSDICRVRNNRFERAEIKERNELCKQIRAEEERTGIYAITLDEVIHLLEIAPSKKYLQSIKAKK